MPLARPDGVRCALLVLGCWVASCAERGEIPVDAQLSCVSSAECPGGLMCLSRSQRCYRREEFASLLVQPEIRPASGRAAVQAAEGITVGGTVEIGANLEAGRFVDAQGNTLDTVPVASLTVDDAGVLSGSLVAPTVPSQEIRLEIIATAQGVTSAPEQSRSNPLSVDSDAPPAPVSELIFVFVERQLDASQEESSFHLELSGSAGAAVAAAELRIYADANASEPSGAVEVNGDGSFAGVALDLSPGAQPELELADQAGNVGPRAALALVRIVNVSFSPAVARAGAQSVRSEQTIIIGVLGIGTGLSLGVTDGNIGVLRAASGSEITMGYVPLGSEPQLPEAARLNLQINDASGAFAEGSGERVVLPAAYDFTAPVLNLADYVLDAATVGGNDSVTVNAGGVSDANTPSAALTYALRSEPDGSLIATGSVDADGSVSPLDLGDDLYARIRLEISDPAGNVVGASLDNDIAAPTVALHNSGPGIGPQSVDFVGLGATVVIEILAEDASPLDVPTATFGGVDMALAARTAQSGGEVLRFEGVVSASLSSGFLPVSVTVGDVLGHSTSVTPTGVRVDVDRPSSAIESPAAGSFSGQPEIRGTAADPDCPDTCSDISTVGVRIHDVDDNTDWNGAAFVGGEAWLTVPVVGGRWALSTAAVAWQSHDYELSSRARDKASNDEITGSPTNVSLGAPTVDVPLNVQAELINDLALLVTWDPPSNGTPTSYSVYRGFVGVTAPPFETVNNVASGGSNEILLTGLPAGELDIAVTASDANGEGPRSANLRVRAASATRRWPLNLDPSTVPCLVQDAWLVWSYLGGVWRSTDDGATWSIAHAEPDEARVDCLDDIAFLTVRPFMDPFAPGRVFRSGDGGVQWTEVTPFVDNFSAVREVSDRWIALLTTPESASARSDDDGLTWEAVPTPGAGLIESLSFSDDVVVAAGLNAVWVQRDDEVSFRHIPLVGAFESVAIDGDWIVVVGDTGRLAQSFDGGGTWEQPLRVTFEDLWGVALRAGKGVAMARTNAPLTSIITRNGGQSWVGRTIFDNDPDPTGCPPPNCIGAPAGWPVATGIEQRGDDLLVPGRSAATGLPRLLTSSDQGDTWRVDDLPSTATDVRLQDGQLLVADRGFGAPPSFSRAPLGQAPATWVTLEALEGFLTAGHASGDTVVVSASNGRLLVSHDGGHSYGLVNIATDKTFWDVWGDGQHWVAVGGVEGDPLGLNLPTTPGRLIARSIDGGDTFEVVTDNDTEAALFKITGGGPTTVVAAGLDGQLLVSNDSGANWTDRTIDDSAGSSFVANGRVGVWTDGTRAIRMEHGRWDYSTDSGATWGEGGSVTSPVLNRLPMLVVSVTPTVLFLGTGSGSVQRIDFAGPTITTVGGAIGGSNGLLLAGTVEGLMTVSPGASFSNNRSVDNRKSTNGGTVWTAAGTYSGPAPRNAVGTASTIFSWGGIFDAPLRSTPDLGATWVESLGGSALIDVVPVAPGNLVIVNYGRIEQLGPTVP